MRIVSLEEHISFPELTKTIPKGLLPALSNSPVMKGVADKLADVTGERLQSMDDDGITMQVLSVTGAGAELLSPKDGPAFAEQYNNAIAQKIAGHTNRFAAFAHLPMTAPLAAADELERAVKDLNFRGALINGLTQEEFLDDKKFHPIFQRAEQLDVPIYLHPALPPEAVNKAYYSDLPKGAGMVLSIAGWGWHSETALHILRLIVSGTLDKYPRLKIIIGHMGEMLPMMMHRCDNVFGINKAGANRRSISQTLREQVYITTSGIFTQPPLTVAIDTFGIDNIMFSVDYPFSSNDQGLHFLRHINLPEQQIAQIAHGNADRILKL